MSRHNRHYQSCRELHVVVLGAGGVGKSCLTGERPAYQLAMLWNLALTANEAQFVHNEWIESYDPTIEDTYRTQLQVDVRTASCLGNVSGGTMQQLSKVWHLTFKPALIPQAQNNSVSLSSGVEHCPSSNTRIVAMRDLYMKSGQGFILVFSITSSSSMNEIEMLREEITRIKDDDSVPIVIVGNKADLEEQRSVPRQRAFACSQMWDAPYYETSARTRTNVDAVFIDICRQLLLKDERSQAQAIHEEDEHENEKNAGIMGFAKRKNRRRRRADGHRCVIL
nr:ras small monomeric GTPase [Colletotrichum truncatum]KAF6800580.1 ras small monomeric GTPase [Colletotrichum truncatum]